MANLEFTIRRSLAWLSNASWLQHKELRRRENDCEHEPTGIFSNSSFLLGIMMASQTVSAKNRRSGNPQMPYTPQALLQFSRWAGQGEIQCRLPNDPSPPVSRGEAKENVAQCPEPIQETGKNFSMSGELARWENESSPERREEQIGTKLIEQKYQMLDKTRDMEMGR
jgi:hypothetical protein